MSELRDGVPCSHPGCASHLTHPCEGCGRIGMRRTQSGLMDKLPLPHETWQILAEAISTYGEGAQLDMVVEECGELIVAIQHYRREAIKSGISIAVPTKVLTLLDEVADVYIMILQLMLMAGPDNVGERVAAKLARLQDRLEARKQAKRWSDMHKPEIRRNILGPIITDDED